MLKSTIQIAINSRVKSKPAIHNPPWFGLTPQLPHYVVLTVPKALPSLTFHILSQAEHSSTDPSGSNEQINI